MGIKLNKIIKLNKYLRSRSVFDYDQRPFGFQIKNLFSQKLLGQLKLIFIEILWENEIKNS